MRVAVDLTSLADNFTGIERYAACMAKALIEVDSRNSYVLIFKDKIFPWFNKASKRKNVEVKIVQSKRHGKLWFTQIMLPRVLMEVAAEKTLFLAFPAPLLFSGPSISTIHDLSCYDCPETMTWKSRLLWRALDGHAVSTDKQVITISKYSKERIINHYKINPDRVTVAYCGIDKSSFNTFAGKGREEEVKEKYSLPDKYILSLATIEPRKNLPLLIDAWMNANKDGKQSVDLVLAGRRGWKTSKLLANVPDKLVPRIHFTGYVEDEDLPILYRGSLAFVYPSNYEGFGLPPVEAAACGARVLCSDIPPLREACGASAEYFRPKDSASLQRLLLTAGERHGEGRGPEFSWRTEAKKIVNTINLVE